MYNKRLLPQIITNVFYVKDKANKIVEELDTSNFDNIERNICINAKIIPIIKPSKIFICSTNGFYNLYFDMIQLIITE